MLADRAHELGVSFAPLAQEMLDYLEPIDDHR